MTAEEFFENLPNKTLELEKLFEAWSKNKHSLHTWLPLTKYLALQIDNDDENALKLRDLCITEVH